MRKFLIAAFLMLVAVPALAQTPEPTGPGDRLGYTQQTTATELPQLSWEVYLDGTLLPSVLQNTTCTVNQADPTRYDCIGSYPAMTPGVHTIELVTVRTQPSSTPGVPPLIMRSPKSSPFAVKVEVNPNAATGLHNVRGN